MRPVLEAKFEKVGVLLYNRHIRFGADMGVCGRIAVKKVNCGGVGADFHAGRVDVYS